MPVEFSRSLRSLNRDGFGRSVAGVVVVALLLGAWLAWFLVMPVARYEVTDRARIEVDRSSHEIQSPVDGRVIRSNLILGRQVEAGDLIVEIESDAQQLQMREEESRIAAIEPQLDALRAQLAAEERAASAERQANAAALDRSRAQYREAEAQQTLAGQEADRTSRLRAEGLVPERDMQRAQADAVGRKAAGEASKLETTRAQAASSSAESERQAMVERLHREIRQLEGARATAVRTMERLHFEVTRRHIVAPVAGRLGEVAVLKPGGWVEEGDRLGSVVPPGDLRIVAEFLPAALGRIQPGQHAWMRLDGFPWTQYGSIHATVQQTGNEVRDGRVRVELLVDPEAGTAAPVQHGLPGTVEVQVETVTPAKLAMRTAGRVLARPVIRSR